MQRVDSLEKTLMLGGIGAGGEGDDRGWDGWKASPTQWTWVWINSRSWWWTGSPGMLRFMGPQIVGHNWATKLNWTELKHKVLQKQRGKKTKFSGNQERIPEALILKLDFIHFKVWSSSSAFLFLRFANDRLRKKKKSELVSSQDSQVWIPRSESASCNAGNEYHSPPLVLRNLFSLENTYISHDLW